MRESFGGSFIINLLLVFIVVFISFMAVTISYAKAFRVKNQVINILEQNQYSGSGDSTVIDKVDNYLSSVAYNVSGSGVTCDGDLTARGACITTKGTSGAQYYKVTTYIKIDFPFFSISLVVPVSGETKIIY